MFVRTGAVTPGPSRECDITFFVKGRPKSARQSRIGGPSGISKPVRGQDVNLPVLLDDLCPSFPCCFCFLGIFLLWICFFVLLGGVFCFFTEFQGLQDQKNP